MALILNCRKLFSRLVKKSILPKAFMSKRTWKDKEEVEKKEVVVMNILSTTLKCSETKALEMYVEIRPMMSLNGLNNLKENIELLMGNRVSLESCTQNALLLTIDTGKN